MKLINLTCPFCESIGDFNDRDSNGIVCCHGCGRSFDSTKPKAPAPIRTPSIDAEELKVEYLRATEERIHEIFAMAPLRKTSTADMKRMYEICVHMIRVCLAAGMEKAVLRLEGSKIGLYAKAPQDFEKIFLKEVQTYRSDRGTFKP